MRSEAEIREHDASGVPLVEPLWNALFDHHLSIGAAGLATIPRELSWPRRRAHYDALFTERPNTALWVATLGGEPVAYALAYEDALDCERAFVLETLSVLPAARGHGLGTRLMETVDERAAGLGIGIGAVDVMGGNPRARELYRRSGYSPLSESWMRSRPPESTAGAGPGQADLVALANDLGLRLSTAPGPDDTWESADEIAELSGTPEHPRAAAGLRRMFAALESAGRWTIRFELPAAPAARGLREFLADEGFRLSTERLSHALERPANAADARTRA